jgi:phage host-nuclease inhibitor protein Gam
MSETIEFICSTCNKICKDRKGLTLHESKCDKVNTLICSPCKTEFKTHSSLVRHEKTCKAIKEEIERKQKKEQDELIRLSFENEKTELLKKNNDLEERIKMIQKNNDYTLQERLKEILCLQSDFKKTSSLLEECQQAKKELEKEVKILNREILFDKNRFAAHMDKPALVHQQNIQNIQHNHFVPLPFDTSVIQGRINPPNRMVNNVEQLVDHLFKLGLSNYFRISDKSRKTAVWAKSDGRLVEVDSKCKELSNYIVESLQDEVQRQKIHLEEELHHYQSRENLDTIKIQELNEHINFCNRLINREEKLMKELGSCISKHGKDKEDTSVDRVRDMTFIRFIAKLETCLLTDVSEWMTLSFYDIGKYIGFKMKDYFHTEGASKEDMYIVAYRDDDVRIMVYSDKLQSFIKESVSEKLFDNSAHVVIRNIIETFGPESVKEKFNYLENPTLPETQEIMKGIVCSC